MKRKQTSTGGYIGLVMLLVGMAIIAVIIVRTDLFTGGKNMIEQGNDAVDAAQKAKDAIEQRDRELLKEYDYNGE